MPDLEDSTVDPPQGRCCCALSKKGSTILHGTAVTILLLVILLCYFFVSSSAAASLVVQAVAYPAIACLYIFTSSSRKERIISGIFLGVLAVSAAPGIAVSSNGGSLPVPWVFGANIVAISVYVIWQLHPLLVQAWLRCVLAHATAVATQLHFHGEQHEEVGRPVQQHTKFRIEGLPREYSYGEIQAMTKDFGSMVGRGGSAAVFRGLLDDDTVVAVKRIAVKRITGDQSSVGEAEFLTEVTILAGVQHRSLVRLLGYCLLRGGDRYLVYPFFENRSLDSWLFAGEERRLHLPWPTRRRIAVDVARALAYLHHECRQQILHLDIKPANILLDGGLRAHVSDFGISMSIGRDLTSVDTRGRGTVGYMAPEMLVNALSAKSDVYSYGMTLLELVGGRRNFELADGASATPDFTRDFFPCVVRARMAEGSIMEVVDDTMVRGAAGLDEEEVKVVVKVALWCIQHSRDTRPSMPTVVEMLEGRIPVEMPPESRVFVLNFSEPLSSSVARGP